MKRVPVLRPKLPSADRLLPYLQSIDRARIYSNYGPLSSELEHRLSDYLRLPSGAIVCTSSGTTAIIGAVLAAAGRAKASRPLALLPAFTFVATASAVEQCGYRPYLADIDAQTWMLDPERLVGHPLLPEVGVVVPVAPFGRPVPQALWCAFRQKTGIPVVIDGGASFDTIAKAPDRFINDIPVALSFHATKSFATGEGGAVVTTDVDRAACAMQSLNFGFYGTRDCRLASTNGKMSEYHAAVGLAELDGWAEKQSDLSIVIGCYRRLAEEVRVAQGLHISPDVSTSYVLLLCRTVAESASVQKCFDRSGIDFRLWYGTGVHRQTYYSNLARDCLNTTEMLAPRLLGLPVAPDLSETSIRRVVTALTEGIAMERLNPGA